MFAKEYAKGGTEPRSVFNDGRGSTAPNPEGSHTVVGTRKMRCHKRNSAGVGWSTKGEGVGWRYVTTRELARLQGLGDDFVIPGNKVEATQMIGNGVPVEVGEAIAYAATGRVKEYKDKYEQTN